jgi:hypothetical protein
MPRKGTHVLTHAARCGGAERTTRWTRRRAKIARCMPATRPAVRRQTASLTTATDTNHGDCTGIEHCLATGGRFCSHSCGKPFLQGVTTTFVLCKDETVSAGPRIGPMRLQVITHNVGGLFTDERLDAASYSGPSPEGMARPQQACGALSRCFVLRTRGPPCR